MIIWICDDSPSDRQLVKETVIEFLNKKHIDAEVESFARGSELVEALNQNNQNPHLILLDIDMPEMSGMDVAKKLRQNGGQEILIFISSYEQYVFESLKHQPYRYIRKAYIGTELPLALRDAYELYQFQKDKRIMLIADEGEQSVSIHEIMYCELEGRKISIHLNDGTQLHIRKSLKEFSGELNKIDSIRFFFSHSGCVVNAEHVRSVDGEILIMKNDEKVLMSRRNRREARERMYEYWGNLV